MTMDMRASRGGAGALLATLLAVSLLVLAFPGNGRGSRVPSASAASAAATPLGRLAESSPSRPVEVIVRTRPGTAATEVHGLVRAAGGRITHDLHLIDAVGARMTAAAAQRLSTDPLIRGVSLPAPVRMRAVSTARLRTAYPKAIEATNLWNLGEGSATGRGVGVAVIDTGVAGDLPDFRVSRYNRVSRVRASVVVNREATTPEDTYGHGTHVAGIIAGDGNNRRLRDPRRGRYIGVAPDARIVSVKVSDDEGRASTLDVIHGIQFAVDHAEHLDIRIINLSLSATEPGDVATDPLNAAVQSAWVQGLVVVAAAGNDGTAQDAVSHAPGNDPFAITVGATDDQGTMDETDDAVASWSSRGLTREGVTKPDVLAPGARIVSTSARGSDFREQCSECVVDGHYFRAGGSSMAAAVASGAAALLLERHPEWTPDQVKAALARTGRDVSAEGKEVRLDRAVAFALPAEEVAQDWAVNQLVDPVTGAIDYTAASWRAASWRMLEDADPLRALWAAASWRCVDCGLTPEGDVDPAAASWRAASWRTSFNR